MDEMYALSDPDSPVIKEEQDYRSENSPTPKKSGKRGRKPSKIDVRAKLERSRQSARECRARKKLRYQYLEELVSSRERAIHTLRDELEKVKGYCSEMDKGNITDEAYQYITMEKEKLSRKRLRTESECTTDGDE